MTCHITDFYNFYNSPLGNITQTVILNMVKEFWPSMAHYTALCMGYPLPYLNVFQADNEKIFVFMPAQQGVVPWPETGPCSVSLVEENYLPLADESVDRILLVHCLEHSEQAHHFLREVWRILSPQGRLLVITPNRRGLWARFDHTPFGHGNPYTMTQLCTALKNTQFTPIIQKRGLYIFPSQSRIMLTLSPLIESIGSKIMPKFSGLVALECTKQIYAIPPLRQRKIMSFPSFLGAQSS